MSSFLCPLVSWEIIFKFKHYGMVELYLVHVVWMGIAAVQLDVVYAPGLECLGVFLEVSKDAGVASTGVVPVVLIYPKLETLRVDIVAESLDPTGEPGPVRLEVATSAHNTTALHCRLRSQYLFLPCHKTIQVKNCIALYFTEN